MKTLEMMVAGSLPVPMGLSWQLTELGRLQGAQELYTRQSPQRLKVLREHAIAQSAISSNRIEGVEIDQKRVGTVVFGHPALKDRNEEQVAGYRDALNWIHHEASDIPVAEDTILKLHRMSRGEIWDAGLYKDKPVDIIERHADGRVTLRFQSVEPALTPEWTRKLTGLWQDTLRERSISPYILLAAFNLDFLCIHPFRDGNGRVSRLLWLLTCYHAGIEVGRYISLESLVERHKERYYETLHQSSQAWHEGQHDPWPYIGYVLFILKEAYRELAERAGQITAPKGEKSAIVKRAIEQQRAPFRLQEIERLCPGIGRDWIRKILFEMKKNGQVICEGRGRAASWRRNDE